MVEFAGPCSREEVAELYGDADIFVFPSVAETFGFPMAEAMLQGLPMVAADTPVNREVCGRAAVYFNPLSAEDLARRLKRLSPHRRLCQRLGARAREEATTRFRWSEHARRILEAAGCLPSETERGRKSAADSAMGANLQKVPVSVLVLTRNEEANIAECLESVGWADEVFVVDSFSTDRTGEIAERLGAKVYPHTFSGYAAQRNWALDYVPFSNEWVLMLDADERIPAALAGDIARAVCDEGDGPDGYYLTSRHHFLGRWLKHGGLYPTWILRLFRWQHVRFEDRPMNEHAILEGRAGYLRQPYEHQDRKPLSNWVVKHTRYAGLEAEEFLQETLAGGYASSIPIRLWGRQEERKRWIKLRVWNRLPLLLRPFLFFFRNYFLRLGFLDGRPGFIYHVLWSFWYPFLVSASIMERRYEGRRKPAEARPRPPAVLRFNTANCGLPQPGNVQTSATSPARNDEVHHRFL